MVTKEATYLVSLPTEEFIKRLSEASHRVRVERRGRRWFNMILVCRMFFDFRA